MKYKEGVSFIEFIDEIIVENGGSVEHNTKYGKSSEGENKSKRRKLKKIFRALEMEDILKDERYKNKENRRKKTFPIHLQILCYVLLSQESSKKEDFVNKIENGRFEKITEEEIDKFCEQIEKEFDCWLDSLEYSAQEKNERNREQLDAEFLKMEEKMLEDESVEIVESLEPNEKFTQNEIKYLQKKLRIKMEKNIFVKDVKDKIFFKGLMIQQIKEIHDLVDEKLNFLLRLNEASGKITILNDYDSEFLDDIIPLPIEYTQNQNGLLNRDKCEILEDIKKEGFDNLDLYERFINAYIKEKKNSYGRNFVEVKEREKLRKWREEMKDRGVLDKRERMSSGGVRKIRKKKE